MIIKTSNDGIYAIYRKNISKDEIEKIEKLDICNTKIIIFHNEKKPDNSLKIISLNSLVISLKKNKGAIMLKYDDADLICTNVWIDKKKLNIIGILPIGETNNNIRIQKIETSNIISGFDEKEFVEMMSDYPLIFCPSSLANSDFLNLKKAIFK